MRAVRVAMAGVLLMIAAYAVSVVPGVRPHEGYSPIWEIGVYAGEIYLCGVVCLLRARSARADRAAWVCFGVGLISYGSGTTVFNSLWNDDPAAPFPSAADALWLTQYPLVIIGIVLLVRPRLRGSVLTIWLDGVVCGLGLASVSAAFVFPRITAGASGPTATIVTNFAYPTLDLVLSAAVVGAMAALGAWRERIWLLVGAATLVSGAADSWYLLQVADDSYHTGSPVDVMFLIGSGFMAAAATWAPPRPAGSADQAESRSFLLPGAFALVAITVLVIGSWKQVSTLGLVLAVVALLAAWTRTALAVREVVRLSDSRRQALTDALTGLPNRRAFYELLEDPAPGSVLMVDLDRFKEINDALGHQVGDLVLKAVAQRFSTLVPPGATLARLGGDELALLLPGLTTDAAAHVADGLQALLERPFTFADTALHVDASIGIAAVEPAYGQGSGAGSDRAMAKADLAMYRAKKARTGSEVYDDDRDGDGWDRLATVEALRTALADGGLFVEFQPIVAAGTGPGWSPAGAEALIRWTHPERGRIPPDAFLPLAEHAGLMPAVTRTVLDQSFDAAAALRSLGRTVPISVNLSASDLVDDALVDFVAAGLARRGLASTDVRIEITESLLVEGAGAAAFLTRLRDLGLSLAVDDYGTGYSSLAYLHDLPVSYLKIDRAFTDRLPHDERTAVIVASTIEMAHRLQLRVVAEGVETADQRDWLHAHGCDLLQGYHISRPIPLGDLQTWLAGHLVPEAAGQAAPTSP